MQKNWLPVSPLLQRLPSADVWRRLITDRDIMAEQAIMEALVPVPDIGHHFMGRKDCLVGIDTSVTEACMANIGTSIGGIFVAVMDGTLVMDIFAAGAGMLVVGIGAEMQDTSARGDREIVIEAVIVADEIW